MSDKKMTYDLWRQLAEIDLEVLKSFRYGQRLHGHYRSSANGLSTSTYKLLRDKGVVAAGGVYLNAFLLGWKDGESNGVFDIYPYSDQVLELLHSEVESVINHMTEVELK